MVRYHVKRCGPAPRVDHSVIKDLIRKGLGNIEIAAITGYTSGYIGELRNREERKKRRLSEGRVC